MLVTREGASVVLELDNGIGSLLGHVVDSVLVTEPIGTLDGVVHVPSPVVLMLVTESGVDTSLGGGSMTTGREKLGETRRVETILGETDSSSETGTTTTDDDGIVLVVLRKIECESIGFQLQKYKAGSIPRYPQFGCLAWLARGKNHVQ